MHNPIIEALTHPNGLQAIQMLLFGAAAFTKPTSSLRYAAIVGMALIAYDFHLTVHYRVENRMMKAIPAGTTVGTILGAVERLLVNRWYYEAGGPEAYQKRRQINGRAVSKKTDEAVPKQPAKSRLRFTYDMLCSPRSVGKPWQVKNVPRFSSSDPSYVPSRRAFLLHVFALSVLCFLIFDILSSQPPPNARLVAATQQPFFGRISDVTLEELIFRVASSLGYWISAAAYLSLLTYICAFFAVASGLDKPVDWPSNFDSPTTAYSVRQFWGQSSLTYMMVKLSD